MQSDLRFLVQITVSATYEAATGGDDVGRKLDAEIDIKTLGKTIRLEGVDD